MLKSSKELYGVTYRLRVGNYRILYEIVNKELLLIIFKAGHRKDIYK
ncbi:MAG: type II toxin-antitoxin system RelE/ParE family toxin [Ignavibacteria bacterium]|nr:type II toxin-antitoxin system RelE/ParE family toxin [Ignavibacteria bacterium]